VKVLSDIKRLTDINTAIKNLQHKKELLLDELASTYVSSEFNKLSTIDKKAVLSDPDIDNGIINFMKDQLIKTLIDTKTENLK
jgi:hypothetical protein